jgi:hypothetical protein
MISITRPSVTHGLLRRQGKHKSSDKKEIDSLADRLI